MAVDHSTRDVRVRRQRHSETLVWDTVSKGAGTAALPAGLRAGSELLADAISALMILGRVSSIKSA